MIDINGSEVRARFEVVATALRLAIDFLRTNLHVRHVKFLPYTAQLIPLTAYFSENQAKSVPASDHQALLRWFWRSSFAHRYSGNPGRNIKSDVEQARRLRKGAPSSLDDIATLVPAQFFIDNQFNTRTVASKATVLLLAGLKPKTFLSGQGVALDAVLSEPNRKEYHHCMPKAWVKRLPLVVPDSAINALANFAIISRAENRAMKDKAPSVYRKLMPANIDEIGARALLPGSLWDDDVVAFLGERSELLANVAQDLIE